MKLKRIAGTIALNYFNGNKKDAFDTINKTSSLISGLLCVYVYKHLKEVYGINEANNFIESLEYRIGL